MHRDSRGSIDSNQLCQGLLASKPVDLFPSCQYLVPQVLHKVSANSLVQNYETGANPIKLVKPKSGVKRAGKRPMSKFMTKELN